MLLAKQAQPVLVTTLELVEPASLDPVTRLRPSILGQNLDRPAFKG